MSVDLPVSITSRSNPLVKSIVSLRQSARRRRDQGVTLVEGFKILRLALNAGHRARVVLYTVRQLNGEDRETLRIAEQMGASVKEVSSSVLEIASAREGPLGCVASVELSETRLDAVKLRSRSPLLVLMEGLEKPGNLGSIARTASAAGADALLAVDSQTDIFSPATVHASLGSVFDLPVVRCSVEETLHFLAEHRIDIVATTPGATTAYYDIDLVRPVAVAVGNEHRGLSDAVIAAGTGAFIPMHGVMNSLNATIAGGIVLFEALRQRAAIPQ